MRSPERNTFEKWQLVLMEKICKLALLTGEREYARMEYDDNVK